MRAFGTLLLLLLAAAASAILSDPVPTYQSPGDVVYEVRATVSLESPKPNVANGTELQYAGELALYPVGQDTYQARFLNFSVIKHESPARTACPRCRLETLTIAPPERRYPPANAAEDLDSLQGSVVKNESTPLTACPGCSLETLIIAPPERRYPPANAADDLDSLQGSVVKNESTPLTACPGCSLETLIILPPERRYPPANAAEDLDNLQGSVVKNESTPLTACPGCSLETLIIAPPERRYPPANAAEDLDSLQGSVVKNESTPLTACPGCSLETLIIAPPERRYPPANAAEDLDSLQGSVVKNESTPLTACPGCSLETLIIAPPERRYPPANAAEDLDSLQGSVVKNESTPLTGCPGCSLETLIIAPPERLQPLVDAVGDIDYSQVLSYPVQFVLRSGKVVKYEISLGAPAWIHHVYKSVLTLLQNQVDTPRELPAVASYYEDGVSGYCRVTYEVHSLTNLHAEYKVYNMTKTKNLDDCQPPRTGNSTGGAQRYRADHSERLSNNLLPLPLDSTSTSENKSSTERPKDLNTVDSAVTAHEVSYYRVNGSLIENALSESLATLPVLGGTVLVRTRLQLELASHGAPPVDTAVQFDGEPRTSLKLNLSEVAEHFDGYAYGYLMGSPERVKPEVFAKLLDEVAEELASLEISTETKRTPATMLKLVSMISLLNTEQLKQAMPPSLLSKTSDLEPKEQLLRALYIDLLRNARSRSAVEMALHLMKQQLLSRQEIARLFGDLSVFLATFLDTNTRELLRDLCRSTEGFVDLRLRAATCSHLGNAVTRGCPHDA
ncbi:uncharacterized protein LOC142560478 [Dermacentor variabilis]|uniref:uncharacterized protein LOC142560478 n=1 Tax=Dermacentor variabilis TaxID=34621 RepID=UPI003F5BACA6